MPTPDRTTIRAAIQELTTQLRDNLVADPPTATRPFRTVEAGPSAFEEFARPFLTLWIVEGEPMAAVDDDRIVVVTMGIRVVVDAFTSDSHEAVLDAVGAVDDYFDSLIDAGLIDGADGFEDRAWRFEYPRSSSGARAIAAEARQTFVVKVERGQNRVPA